MCYNLVEVLWICNWLDILINSIQNIYVIISLKIKEKNTYYKLKLFYLFNFTIIFVKYSHLTYHSTK